MLLNILIPWMHEISCLKLFTHGIIVERLVLLSTFESFLVAFWPFGVKNQ